MIIDARMFFQGYDKVGGRSVKDGGARTEALAKTNVTGEAMAIKLNHDPSFAAHPRAKLHLSSFVA